MVDRRTYTPDEYQSSFIDFYGGFGGIDTSKAPEVGEEIKPTTASPDIMKPVGTADDETNIFSGVNIGTGAPSFKVGDVDYKKYLEDFSENPDEKSKAGEDRSLGGFVEWAKNELQRKPEIAIGIATGIPGAGALAAVGASLNRKQQLKNANKISETGGTGGSMFKVGNQTISRAPGSRIYSGNLGGMTQQQVANVEAIKRGFIPGTMQENQVSDEDGGGWQQTGKGYLTSIDGAAMDAYGNIHSAGGPASASQATALREKLFVDAMKAAGISLSGVNVSSAALEMKQALDASARGRIGVFETVRRQDSSTYNTNLGTAQAFINKYVMDTHGSGRTPYDPSTDYGMGYTPRSTPRSVIDSARMAGINVGPETSSRAASSAIARSILDRAAARKEDTLEAAGVRKSTDPSFKEQEQFTPVETGRAHTFVSDDSAGFDYSGFYSEDDDGSGSSAGSSSQDFSDPGSGYDYDDAGIDYDSLFARGGRVGLQMGGTPDAPAGFVERPPSQVSEAATVADDKPMSVPEGTFVINAAAVEIAGEADIAKMLNKAYENYRVRGGKEVMGRTPSKEEIDVAVSRGEVIIPPHIAKIIGYDRLEKINNRGKKETSKRIEENGQRPAGAAGGGFLTRKKFANGGEADLEYEDRIITDEVRRKMKALVASLPDDVDVQSVYYTADTKGLTAEPGYPERQRYEDEYARLNETLPKKGGFFSRSMKKAPATGKRKRVADPIVNVPMTPTLLNLAILAEEVAHHDALKYRQEYDPEKHKVNRRTFEKEQDYLEELRAKDFALSVVGGLFPKGDKTLRGYRASYEKDFAKHLALTDNRELVAAYVKKYPELNRFIEEVSYPEAKMGSKTIPGGSFLTITDDNYYGPGQPRVTPDSSFLDAATREDIIARNEYHASFDYMSDKFKYLVAQLFVDTEKPTYRSGYTASLPD